MIHIKTVDGGEGSAYLPDLNEQPANEEEFLQIHETQQGINLGNRFSLLQYLLDMVQHNLFLATANLWTWFIVNDLDIVFDEEELENSTDEEDEHANGSAQTRSKELTATQRK